MSVRRKANRKWDAETRESKPQAGCGDAGKQGEGGTSVRRRSKPQVRCGDAGKQGEDGMPVRRKARRRRDAETREKESGNTVK